MLYSLVVASDHFQVLVADAKGGPEIDTTHLWDASAGVASLPDEPQLIGIPTVRYGGWTNFRIEVLPMPPLGDPDSDWQKIGTFVLEIESGELILWGPEATDLETVPRIKLDPGRYNGIAYSSGTSHVDDEMSTEGPDTYRISLWPA
ncbi:MAG TPA: hypothetical protein PK156_19350 [Polyangium sp.]|nr:hypothetical protein [Polyangium sp.]